MINARMQRQAHGTGAELFDMFFMLGQSASLLSGKSGYSILPHVNDFNAVRLDKASCFFKSAFAVAPDCPADSAV